MKNYLVITMLLTCYIDAMQVSGKAEVNEKNETVVEKYKKQYEGSIEDVQEQFKSLKKLVSKRYEDCDEIIQKWESKAPHTNNGAETAAAEYKAGIEDLREIRAFLFENDMEQEVKEVKGNIVFCSKSGFMINPIGKVLQLGSTYANGDDKLIAYIKQKELLPYLQFFIERHLGTQLVDGCAMSPAQCLKHAALHQRVKFVQVLIKNGFKQYASEKVNSDITTQDCVEDMKISYENQLKKLEAENTNVVMQRNIRKAIKRYNVIHECLTGKGQEKSGVVMPSVSERSSL